MTSNFERIFHRASTDSDVRWSLLLASVRAFQEVAGAKDATAREDELLAQFAEPVVLPDPLRGR